MTGHLPPLSTGADVEERGPAPVLLAETVQVGEDGAGRVVPGLQVLLPLASSSSPCEAHAGLGRAGLARPPLPGQAAVEALPVAPPLQQD